MQAEENAPRHSAMKQTAKIAEAIAERRRQVASEDAARWLNEHMRWKPCGYEW